MKLAEGKADLEAIPPLRHPKAQAARAVAKKATAAD
jgi:hypothetical protein